MEPDPLDRHRIRRALAGQPVGHHCVFFEETGSTNDEAGSLARAGHPEGTVVFAESQSAGRGRRGNRWVAPARHDLITSVILRPDHPADLWCRLTHLCALALRRAISATTGLEPQIKWPNDLLIDGRKTAGILVEATAATTTAPGFVILGVGLNINSLPEHFPPELSTTATSLRASLGGGNPLPREPVATAFLRALASLYPSGLLNPAFARHLGELRASSSLLGRPVSALVNGSTTHGIAADLGPNGELILDPLPGSNAPRQTLSTADLIRPLDSDSQG